MNKILIIMGRYLPGYKEGGPVRSTKNLVDQLGDEYDIRVACYDRDSGDEQQYPGIKLYEWNNVGKGQVYYVPERGFTTKVLLDLAKQVDIIYMWGCLNTYTIKVIALKRLGIMKNKVVIASMGLFSPKAFLIKYPKKKIVITLMNVLGFFKNVYWSVTSKMEKEELQQQVWAIDSQIYIAEDLPRVVNPEPIKKSKESSKLKVVWISRIAPKKNLVKAIEILEKCKSCIEFTIYGPVFDESYWEGCQEKLKNLPQNIKWEWKGNLNSENVVETLKLYHVFLFPTLGENFGHVIQEALSAGCPCIISDRTPWQDLYENNAGYVGSLENINGFVQSLEKYAAMNQNEYNLCCISTLDYAVKKSRESIKNTGYRKIFEET